MYDLKKVESDFPWALEGRLLDDPRNNPGYNSFEYLPQGWGDVIQKHLLLLEKILTDYNIIDRICVAQVKEKYGTLRFYYDLVPLSFKDDNNKEDINEIPEAARKAVNQCVNDLENATQNICCYCGTTDNVTCRDGWVHYSCDACENSPASQHAQTTNQATSPK